MTHEARDRNARLAARGIRILEAYHAETNPAEEFDETVLIDLLVDLMHACAVDERCAPWTYSEEQAGKHADAEYAEACDEEDEEAAE